MLNSITKKTEYMTPEAFNHIGKKLFGNRFKSQLANLLDYRRETLSSWSNGHRPIPKVVSMAMKWLDAPSTSKNIPYKERRFNAKGELKHIGESLLIHGDATTLNLSHYLKECVDTILVDPVWPNAIPDLAGSHAPYQLFTNMMTHMTQYLHLHGRIIVQMRCDSDPKILSISDQYPFIRAAWLPYAIPSPQGRVLISGDIAYLYGIPPKPREGNRVLPGEIHRDYAPKAQSNKNISHPCPRSLTHVEWLIEKYTNPNDLILDPCMGSGTTAIAALNRGRQFIGVEVERKYWQVAVNRVEKAYQGNTL